MLHDYIRRSWVQTLPLQYFALQVTSIMIPFHLDSMRNISIPYGIHMEYGGVVYGIDIFHMESIWNPWNISIPYGFHMEYGGVVKYWIYRIFELRMYECHLFNMFLGYESNFISSKWGNFWCNLVQIWNILKSSVSFHSIITKVVKKWTKFHQNCLI